MKGSRKILTALAVVGMFSVSVAGRAEMGSVWVEEVGSSHVALAWSEPGGRHALGSEIALYRVSWQKFDPRTSKAHRRENSREVPGLSRFTVSGLDPESYYQFRVEAYTERLRRAPIEGTALSREVRFNPAYRQVGALRQKTAPLPSSVTSAGSLKLVVVGTTRSSIRVECKTADSARFNVIRIAYKEKFNTHAQLNRTSGTPRGPENEWIEVSEIRGWEDFASAPVIEVTFRGLLPATRYEIVAYGLNIGTSDGEKIGRTMGRTGGDRLRSSVAELVGVDHEMELERYGDAVSARHGKSVLEIVAADHADLLYAEEELRADEDEDLGNDFTCLRYLIEREPEIFASWQRKEEADFGLSFLDFMTTWHGELTSALEQEVDPVRAEFQRGDADVSATLNLGDPVEMINYLFLGGEILCEDAADADDSGSVDIGDVIHVLNYLFLGGKTPLQPFGACGVDDTADDLDCRQFFACD